MTSLLRCFGFTIATLAMGAIFPTFGICDVLDAHQSSLPSFDCSGCARCPNYYNTSSLQTFTAATSGVLSSIRIGAYVIGTPSYAAELRLYDMGSQTDANFYFAHTTTLLGSVALATTTLPSTVGWVTFDFASQAIPIVAGNHYALLIAGGGYPNEILVPCTCTDSYAAGAQWGFSPFAGPVMDPIGEDVAFEVYMASSATSTRASTWGTLKDTYKRP
jgi:hypothetical protein